MEHGLALNYTVYTTPQSPAPHVPLACRSYSRREQQECLAWEGVCVVCGRE